MRSLIALASLCFFLSFFVSCKEAGTATSICDTACFKDTLKFASNEHPLKPYVYVSGSNCTADTVTLSYTDMAVNRKLSLAQLAGKPVKLNPAAVGCFIKDTSYAWLSFNDCATGRGYLVKIPYSSYGQGHTVTSAFNAFDPKFKVAEGLAVYSDRGNLFAEDMATGKQAMMTFGQRLEIDYDRIHDLVDSVSVTPTKMWAKVKIGEDWKVIEKNIQLK